MPSSTSSFQVNDPSSMPLGSGHVAIQQNGHHLSVPAEIDQWLGRVLVSHRLSATSDSSHGYAQHWEENSLLNCPRGYRLPNAGLLDIIAMKAQKLGKSIHINRCPPLSRLSPPRADVDYEYPQLADFIYRNERGILRIQKSGKAYFILKDLANAFPNQRVVVLGAKRSELINHQATFHNKDNREFLGQVQFVDAGLEPRMIQGKLPRFILSTFRGACHTDFPHVDIVVFLNASDVSRNDAQMALEQVDARFRVFGIQEYGQNYGISEKGMMMSVFGPRLIDLPLFNRCQREMAVAWVDNHQGQYEDGKPKNSGQPSTDITKNQRRNRFIVSAARAIADGRPCESKLLQPINAWRKIHGFREAKVTIVFDQIDHGLKLGRLLEDFPVVTPVGIDLRGLNRTKRKRLKEGRNVFEYIRPIQIVHTACLRNSLSADSDFLIWAAGGTSIDQIPYQWLTAKPDKLKPLLFVDFQDLFSSTTNEWAKSREKSYQSREIYPVDTHPVLGRINKFLSENRRVIDGQR